MIYHCAADELGGGMTSWTTTAPSAYTDLAQAPIWCSFKGVTCGENRRIRYIFLVGARLEGHLTPLGSLTEMSSFSLAYNRISGSIPQSFLSMPRLSHLYLENNSLTGSITPITSLNMGLLNLYLNDNSLGGSIPESLGLLTGLKSLQLDYNFHEGTIPTTLNRLTKLESLYLNSNLLTGTIPVLNQSSLLSVKLFSNYLSMGSLKEVPVSTFSTWAHIDVHSNCLVYRNPDKPSQNVNATNCKGKST